ncbi:GIY-YIG nuclease family protein [Dactylosporangium aurantiacum]|uniref:GIY-YIG nuclease family protein n=1 Tax=Dactylosporangium aurantiacum TaxID=35754 RepID=A0A9Q9MFW8_9ACTN|nr:GIY-YIG nuclease family protein [Dactylosporangium aurantiacum]MDG6103145.1 GIY-YIG nuclease family protein [Dactylosporangium aurantiacum]UWZ57653.1 GIY-YIG nuclease family protein [Dactylosporangium aurantiacum]
MTTAARTAAASLPNTPGVYRFRDERDRVLYIGRATELRHRVGSYWTSLRGRRHLSRMVAQIVRVEAVACDSVHEAAWLERNLLERSKPRWNRVRGGLEVPIYLRVDRRGAPRLVVDHGPFGADRGPDVFGPYLGGTKARLAVAGLGRVLPLGYTDERLTGAARDMARIRGVDAADRETLLAATVAVLQRRPDAVDAVHRLLVEQRDRAAAGLAFELAERIQQELEAIDWLVAEQKATVPTDPDSDVYGWADGLLVRFEVRGGRLATWTQRACREADARRHLDRTPEHWRPFAARSAELSSRLSAAHHIAA